MEIIFTSGASEANNMAVKGAAFAAMGRKNHLITTKVEHSSVTNAMRQLEEVFGFDVTWLDVAERGVVRLDQLEQALSEKTALVSIMAVNNEVGQRHAAGKPLRRSSGKTATPCFISTASRH